MRRRSCGLSAAEGAILRAVVYASLFEYPLTAAEICVALENVEATVDEVEDCCARSEALASVIDVDDGYYFPAGQSHLVQSRKRRERDSLQVLARQRAALALLAKLPFVRLVAVSGSLAHLNGSADADLDLFVVTAPRRAWSVTVTALVAARLMGARQRLCLNYVITEDALALDADDWFAVNQLMYLRPVAGLPCYGRLLAANPSVRLRYPNFRGRPLIGAVEPRGWRARARTAVERALDVTVAPAVEWVCRRAYRWHLRRRASAWTSPERVRLTDDCLKLHTHSHRADITARFDAALAEVFSATSRKPLAVGR